MRRFDKIFEIHYKTRVDLERKEKLKRFILKLPLGAQLLQLRRKLLNLHQRRKEPYEYLKRKYKLKYKAKQKKIKNKQNKLDLSLYKFRNNLYKFRNKSYKQINRARLKTFSFYYSRCIGNFSKFKKYQQINNSKPVAFEIGSGRVLAAPIGLSLLGFKKVITADIVRLANPEYVQTVIKFYRKHKKFFRIRSCPKIKEKITDENLNEILLKYFNIDYRAPYDTAHTDLPDNSVDYVFANVVFEHIRQELLLDVVKEIFRILKYGGVFYTTIDFKDHYSYMNSEITIYDYLQYSSAQWCIIDKYPLNRLRTSDHLKIFKEAGFEILEVKKQKITDADRAAFATVKVADEFRQKYTDEELMEKGVKIVLRKPFPKLIAKEESIAENQVAPGSD